MVLIRQASLMHFEYIPEPHKMDTDIVKAVSKLLDELRKYGNSFSSDLSKKVLSKDARALAVKRVVALNAVISEIKKSIEPGNDARDIRAVVAKAKDNKDIKDIKTSTKMPWPAPSLEEIISKHEEKIVKMLPVVDQLRSVKKQK
jgi:CBS domain-containing protein